MTSLSIRHAAAPSILALFGEGLDTLAISERLGLLEAEVSKRLHIERSAALGRDAAFGSRFRGRAERREVWLREIEAEARGGAKSRYMITLNIGAA